MDLVDSVIVKVPMLISWIGQFLKSLQAGFLAVLFFFSLWVYVLFGVDFNSIYETLPALPPDSFSCFFRWLNDSLICLRLWLGLFLWQVLAHTTIVDLLSLGLFHAVSLIRVASSKDVKRAMIGLSLAWICAV